MNSGDAVEQKALRAFIEAVDKADTPRALWQIVIGFMRAQGIEMVSYHHHVPPGSAERGVTVVANGFPDDWVCHYIRQKLYLIDPIPELAARTAEPFFWSDVGRLTDLIAPQTGYLKELTDAVPGDGLAVQVFGPSLRNGYVGLGFGGARPDLDAGDVRALQCACQAAHLRYCQLVPPGTPGAAPLSAREREVLEWVARGKSNSVIGDILGVSRFTVDAYLRRIYSKLDVGDRTTAVIRGVGSGLIKGVV